MFKGVLLVLLLGLGQIACENRGDSSSPDTIDLQGKEDKGDGQAPAPASPFDGYFFEGSFAEAKTQAEKAKKIVAVYLRLEKCLTCEVFAEERLLDPAMRAWMEKHAILYPSKDSEHRFFIQTYSDMNKGIAIPAMLFVHPDGRLLAVKESNRNTKSISIEALIETGEKALSLK